MKIKIQLERRWPCEDTGKRRRRACCRKRIPQRTRTLKVITVNIFLSLEWRLGLDLTVISKNVPL